MIIIGYPGIGKSSVSGKDMLIDLESSNFWNNKNERSKDWYISYCKIAEHLSQQGYTVFTSSHQLIIDQLKDSKEKVVIVAPSLRLEEKWVKRLEDRYKRTNLEKDRKALDRAYEHYKEDITALTSNTNFRVYVLETTEYDLAEVASRLKSDDTNYDKNGVYKIGNGNIIYGSIDIKTYPEMCTTTYNIFANDLIFPDINYDDYKDLSKVSYDSKDVKIVTIFAIVSVIALTLFTILGGLIL